MELDEPLATGETPVPELPPLSLGDDQEPLPNIVLGAEPWHGQVPEDWVPIITRDVQRQRRQNPQAPFSDAYLSGMPTKRRKIVNSTKPQGSLPQVIAGGWLSVLPTISCNFVVWCRERKESGDIDGIGISRTSRSSIPRSRRFCRCTSRL